jgi:orotate phosphoribosyltransferase
VVAVRDLVEHLRSNALLTGGEFRLRSGEVSDWYLDARQTTFDGRGARLVAEAFIDVLEAEVTAVGGMTIGADPIAVAVAVVASAAGRPLKAFSVRKDSKEYGAGGRLVGPVGRGDRVAVVEDTTTTGGAVLEAVEAVMAEGIEVAQVIVLVDRSNGAVADLVGGRDITYRALLLPEDLGVLS